MILSNISIKEKYYFCYGVIHKWRRHGNRVEGVRGHHESCDENKWASLRKGGTMGGGVVKNCPKLPDIINVRPLLWFNIKFNSKFTNNKWVCTRQRRLTSRLVFPIQDLESNQLRIRSSKPAFLNRQDASRYRDLEAFLPGLEIF